jgi:hypothetical protein
MARKTGETDRDQKHAGLSVELEGVKRLLMLLLVKLGATSEEIATVLNVDPSGVRRIVPSRGIKRFTLELPKDKS